MSIISKSFKGISYSSTCSHSTLRTILLPLCLLGIMGLLISSHLTYLPSESFRSCRPRTNIAFLKTHKCAGSSIQNLLMRFGDSHNLSLVLPPKGNYIGHPMKFSTHLLPTIPLAAPTYNILAHHTRLDYDQITRVMPSDTVFITIIRDPVTVFESSFIFYGLDRFFAANLHRFISLVPRRSTTFLNRRYRNRLGINQMMFDLGADPKTFNSYSLIRQYVNQLDSWFHLVLVAERMDESLILLKHLMCWDTDDIVVFKVNARDPKYKSNLSEKEILTLKTLNTADQVLYNHFAAKLDSLIKDFGLERMSYEVSLLQQRTRDWYNLCVKEEKPLKALHNKSRYYYNPRVLAFEPRADVNNATCASLTMAELPYTDYLRRKQMLLHTVQSSSDKENTYRHF